MYAASGALQMIFADRDNGRTFFAGFCGFGSPNDFNLRFQPAKIIAYLTYVQEIETMEIARSYLMTWELV
jgi:hypothetical protein